MYTVVIPLYNVAPYIERALRSVLNQTVLPSEILVVDDGSTDRGAEVVEEMQHPLIRIIHQKNQGVSAARNRGIAEAKEKYIAFLDGDDEWKENHLEIISKLIRDYPSCDAYATSYLFSYHDINSSHTRLPIINLPFTFQGEEGVLENYFEMIAAGLNGPLHVDSLVVKRETLDAIGGFPVGVPSGEDLYTLARLYLSHDIAYSKEPTAIYHLGLADKVVRPFLKNNPADLLTEQLVHRPSARTGLRKYIAFWHKNRMTSAILSGHYQAAAVHFFRSLHYQLFQRKIFTSLLVASWKRITQFASQGVKRHITGV